MKLEIGKKYRTRAGDVVGPIEKSPYRNADLPFFYNGLSYTADGHTWPDKIPAGEDIIEEYMELKFSGESADKEDEAAQHMGTLRMQLDQALQRIRDFEAPRLAAETYTNVFAHGMGAFSGDSREWLDKASTEDQKHRRIAVLVRRTYVNIDGTDITTASLEKP